MDGDTPRQIPPGLPISVTLRAQQWDTLLKLLAEGHHQLRVVGPIYGEIERQCFAQIREERSSDAGQ